MLTGDEYKRSLQDGRKVWIFGEGDIADLTVHPATAGLVDEYACWYDRHSDPEWADKLLIDSGAGVRKPAGLMIPASSDDLVAMNKSIYAQAFVGAGNVTHTPAYGALIALGVLDSVEIIGEGNGGRPDVARVYRNKLEEEGLFLTLTGGASVLGDRFRAPDDQSALRIVKETDAGIVVSGRTGMHTSTPFAHDVYVGLQRPDVNQRAMFAVAVNSPGARVVARRPAARYETQFMSPLSSRYDELDAHLWLENVLIPWEKVFAYRFEPAVAGRRQGERPNLLLAYVAPPDFVPRTRRLHVGPGPGRRRGDGPEREPGGGFATRRPHDPRPDDPDLPDRSEPGPEDLGGRLPLSEPAARSFRHHLHPERTPAHGRNSARPARFLAGDHADRPGLPATPRWRNTWTRSFGGGAFTAEQRAALLNLIWDHIASGLDGRESAFELHASGGLALWRNRVQRWFDRGNELRMASWTLECGHAAD